MAWSDSRKGDDGGLGGSLQELHQAPPAPVLQRPIDVYTLANVDEDIAMQCGIQQQQKNPNTSQQSDISVCR